MKSASQHSKGWSGIAFCVTMVASVALMGVPPAANAGAGAILTYLRAQQHSLLWAGWLSLPAAAFFLWFALGLAAWLHAASPDDEGLPAYLRTAAIVTTSVAFVQGAFMMALALRPPADPGFAWELNTLLFASVGAMPFAIFLVAAAHSMRRHASAPAWLTWLGYLAAAGQVLVSFGMFYRSGLATGNDVVYAIAAGLLPLLFVLATSLCMAGLIRAPQAST